MKESKKIKNELFEHDAYFLGTKRRDVRLKNSSAMMEDTNENIFILMGGQNHGLFPFRKNITCDAFIAKHSSDRLQRLLLGQT